MWALLTRSGLCMRLGTMNDLTINDLQPTDLGLRLFSKKNRSCLRGIFLNNFRSGGALALIIIMHVISAKAMAFTEVLGLLFYFFRGIEVLGKIEGNSNLINV